MAENQNLKRRVARVEKRFGVGRDDETVELVLNDRHNVKLARREWDEIAAEITESKRG